MVVKRMVYLLFLVIIAWMGIGCTPKVQSGDFLTPTFIKPKEGTGGMRGVIANLEAFWKDRTVYVFAAEYVGNEQGEGIYVLEPSIHPYTTIDTGGFFQITDMPPGEYVLVVGPSPEEAIVIRKDAKAIIYKVAAGDITDVGAINLSW